MLARRSSRERSCDPSIPPRRYLEGSSASALPRRTAPAELDLFFMGRCPYRGSALRRLRNRQVATKASRGPNPSPCCAAETLHPEVCPLCGTPLSAPPSWSPAPSVPLDAPLDPLGPPLDPPPEVPPLLEALPPLDPLVPELLVEPTGAPELELLFPASKSTGSTPRKHVVKAKETLAIPPSSVTASPPPPPLAMHTPPFGSGQGSPTVEGGQ